MKKIKNSLLVCTIALAAVSCGPSQEEIEQTMFDEDVQSVCECFEANQHDWLAYNQECMEKANTVHSIWKDNPERLKELQEKIAECDKYHKD